MTEHKIIMIIKPGGEIETTVEGIDGPTCEKETAWLDNLGKVTTHEHTADYHKHISKVAVHEHETIGTGTGDDGGSHGTPW